MALNLKATKTFTDDSKVAYDSGYLAVDTSVYSTQGVSFLFSLWKDETTWLASLSDVSIRPIHEGITLDMTATEMVTHLNPSTAKSSVTDDPFNPLDLVNENLYTFILANPTRLKGITLTIADWEADYPDGIPSSIKSPQRD